VSLLPKLHVCSLCGLCLAGVVAFIWLAAAPVTGQDEPVIDAGETVTGEGEPVTNEGEAATSEDELLTTLDDLVSDEGGAIPRIAQPIWEETPYPAAECTRRLQLRYNVDLTEVDKLVEAANIGGPLVCTREGRQLIVQGPEAAVSMLEEAVAKLLYDPIVCETVRLYYVRQPNVLMDVLKPITTHLAAGVQMVGLGSSEEEDGGGGGASWLDEDGGGGTSMEDYKSGDYARALKPGEWAKGEVQIGGGAGFPMLILAGPRSQVRALKQAIAAIDVPHPEVRLDLWAFQISGSDAGRVAKRAQKARDCVETVARLVRGYLHQLEACALADQLRNEQLQKQPLAQLLDTGVSQAQGPSGEQEQEAEPEEVGLADLDELLSGQSKMSALPNLTESLGPRVLITPSGRGRHPLSLTETLTTLLMMMPRQGDSWRETLQQELERQLGEWLDHLCQEDPEALKTWYLLLSQEPTETQNSLVSLLAQKLSMPQQAQGPSQLPSVKALLPQRLLERFYDAGYVDVAQETIGGFLLDYQTHLTNRRALPADRLSRRAADVQVVLQNAERALAVDVQNLFLRPLLAELRAIASSGGRGGLASAGRTSITVLSGSQATVKALTRSYFDVTQPIDLNLDYQTLQNPETLRTALYEALDERPQVWSTMVEGTELRFTPHILPGGGAAELQISLNIGHESPYIPPTEQARRQPTPLSRVGSHYAQTSVYVNSLDLFALSSLTLRTSHARPGFKMPVLSQIPLLGKMFCFPRKPAQVHHESILVISSTILPTGMDLGALVDFEWAGH